MSILDLPEPRQDSDDPQGRRILPYVTIMTLEKMADTFPPEYIPHLVAAVEAIKARNQ